MSESFYPEARYTRFGFERFIPASGSADEVAAAIAKNPEFVAAIQRGIDQHEPGADTNPEKHVGGMGFKQSIAWELIGVPESDDQE